ncbi:MAG: hypothetical protein GXP22_03155 [Gammaproteobacteria bacterium]|nr:hypothetical protein [Gammaproteobacteria bacterium]
MDCSFISETRRKTIPGGSMPASMRARVSDIKEQPMSLELAWCIGGDVKT